MEGERERVIQAAERLVRRGRLEAAIDEYQKVLRDEPDDTRTLNRVGDLYLRLDEVDEAIDLFSRAARHFAHEGFLVKAIAIFKKIIRVDPTRIQIYEALADLYHRQGLINDARSQYQVVADYYRQHGDTRSVLSIHRKLIELEPDDPSHRVRLAEIYLEMGRRSEAMEQYRRIALVMLEHERPDEAARVLEKAVAIDPADLDFLRRALTQLGQGGYSRAAERLRAAAEARNPAVRRLDLSLEEAPAPAEPGPPPATPDPASPPVASEPPVPTEPPGPAPLDSAIGADLIRRAAAAAPPPMDEAEDDVIVLDLDDPTLTASPPAGAAVVPPAAQPPPVVPPAAQPPPPEPPAAAEPPAAPEPVAAPPAAGLTGESDEFVIGLEELDFALADGEPAAPEAAAAPPAEEPGESSSERALELLAEAQVLATYGLDEKAIERFESVLELQPANLEIHRCLIELHLGAERAEEAGAVASLAAAVPGHAGSVEWPRITRLLELHELAPPAAAVPPAAEAEPASAEAAESEPEAAEISAGAAERESSFFDLAAALAAEELEAGEEPPAVAAEPEPARPVAAEPEPAQPVAAEPEPVLPATGSSSRVTSGEFFDLAAELEEELREAEAEAEAAAPAPEVAPEIPPPATPVEPVAAPEPEPEPRPEPQPEPVLEAMEEAGPPGGEQSLEEIVEGFKRGVAATLAKEDYDTHYNLGIAYREMGLIDEAIGEFQLAAKDPTYLVDCCSLLGSCFLEKGYGDLAVKWYRRGLASPNIQEEEALGLLYELGNLQVALDSRDEALATFVEIYGINSNYRDVVAKLEELRQGG